MTLIVVIIVCGLAIAAWLHFTKAGKAELAVLEADLATVKSKLTNLSAAQKPPTAPAPPPPPAA